MKTHFFIQLSDVIMGLCLSLLKGGVLLYLLLRRRHLIGGSTCRKEMSNRGHHKKVEKCQRAHTYEDYDMSKVVEDRGR